MFTCFPILSKYLFIPQTASGCRGSGGLSLVLGFCAGGCAALYGGQLLCAGCGDRAWCLRPSRTKRPVAPLSTEKHNSFGMIFLRDCPGLLGASGCLWGPPGSLLGASGCLLGAPWVLLDASWVPPGCPLVPPGYLLGPPGFLLQDSSSRISSQGDSSSRIPPPGFLLQDSSSKIPPPGFLLQDSSSRIPPPGFPLQDSSSRIPPP